jgi:hypothetical protein
MLYFRLKIISPIDTNQEAYWHSDNNRILMGNSPEEVENIAESILEGWSIPYKLIPLEYHGR